MGLAGALIAAALSGCVSVKAADVQRIDVALLSETGAPVSAVVPGKIYSMSLTAYLDDNSTSNKVDHTKVLIESAGLFDIVRTNKRDTLLRATDYTLQPSESGKYPLSVSLIDNPAVRAETYYPVDWDSFTLFERSGAKGSKGSKGSDGRDGRRNSSSSNDIDGSDGGTGDAGHRGYDGPEMTVLAVFYGGASLPGLSVGGDRVLLLYSVQEKQGIISLAHPFAVKAVGGEGGDGGDGGDGGAAGSYTEVKNGSRTTKDGRPGKGGSGGRGGVGGNGGSITLLYTDESVLNLIKTDVSGGNGGAGGKPGRNGIGTGNAGSRGAGGTVATKRISHEEALSMLSSMDRIKPELVLKP